MRTGYKEFKKKCTDEDIGQYYAAFLWATHNEEEFDDGPEDINQRTKQFIAWISTKHKSFERKRPDLVNCVALYDKAFQEWIDYRCVQERRTK